VTVLSRCQRFDLRRVDQATLAPHLARIAQAEGAALSAEAIALLARAADGSVRDGLSLLDWVIATFGGKGAVDAAAIREMMGLADRTHVFDLFEAALGGRAAEALDRFAQACHGGADPIVLLNDLLELVHWTTRVKLAPEAADDPAIPEAERVRGRAAAQALSMASLTRAWQILLKGLGEAQGAPDPGQAAEMALVRLAFAAELPTPADLVQRLQKETNEHPASLGPSGPAPSGNGGVEAVGRSAPAPRGAPARGPQASALAPQNEPVARQAVPERPNPKTFAEAVQLFDDKKEAILHAHLLGDVHLVRFEPGRLEFRLGPRAPRDLPNRVQKLLSDWTGRQWGVSLSREAGAESLVEQASAAEQARRADAAANPLVKAVLETFPGAAITAVRDLDVGGADEAPPPVEQDSEDA
jgi:DNA polymerase-3 subunit gamma/tau